MSDGSEVLNPIFHKLILAELDRSANDPMQTLVSGRALLLARNKKSPPEPRRAFEPHDFNRSSRPRAQAD